jgi:iron transport multicopper oxidase
MDGLRAPLILHDPTPPYTYDEELIVTMNDWYHDQSETGLATFLNVYNPTGAEPVPRKLLLYHGNWELYREI